MTGIAWTIHGVHYPLFVHVADDRWGAFHAEHSRRITRVVGVPWAVEGLTTAALLVARPAGVAWWPIAVIALCAATTVVATITLAIPVHQRLAAGPDVNLVRRLVATGLVRTLAWTADGVITAFVVLHRG